MKQCKLSDVLDQYQTLLQPGLRMLEGYEAKIVVDPEARPHFCKARSVPYAMRAKVKKRIGSTANWGHYQACPICRLGCTDCSSSEE